MTQLTDEQWAEIEPLAIDKAGCEKDVRYYFERGDHAIYVDALRTLADAEIAYNEKMREIMEVKP